jgi:hypothetical protein
VNLPDQSVQPVSSPKARLSIQSIVFRSPPRSLSMALWIIARNTVFVSFGYRSVNPGTGLIMRSAGF